MLPTTAGRGLRHPQQQQQQLPHYLRRIVKWRQMDVEYTFWQMLHLCTAPKVVYQHTKYHKQTKNQWARDDPAFTVISSIFLALAASAYCAAYGSSFLQAGVTVVGVVWLHFLLTGISLASICWFLCNRYLREEAAIHSHVVEQRVEWLYAFDVHCNAYFPLFIVLYVIHYFFSPLLILRGFVPTLLSNLFFLVSLSYYHYLNFLGYDVLPFLERTTFFLYPVAVLVVLFPCGKCRYLRIQSDEVCVRPVFLKGSLLN
ncbi:protein unc-50 homolog isoform X2 [Selaginella moellendorffii]|uniref:protein unc-50 homolog isoform X2 n=1 Tax=Selaginella moellendorffii TaxID=88036 RepID=UPI000D1CB87F|nr:protein unc-50 homolog isoform X2 [Selaginella moellendorffii]|eukprot:XP_024542245.1 protein unc-50 homolog isoform X2 [Selaginella moellendorffii]